MKILFFGTYFYPYISGITTYPLKILSYLAEKNEVTALAFNHQDNKFSQDMISGVTVKRMPYLFRLSKGFISLQSVKHFFKEARNNDIIFINFPNAEGLLLLIFAKLFKKKIVGIFHCRVFLTGGFFATIINSLLNVVVWMQMFLADKIVIYTHDYFQSMSVEKIFTKKILQIYPPIEIIKNDDKYYRDLLKQKGNDVWIGFSGRIAKEKGVEFLIGAVSQLQKNYSKKIKIVFVGPIGKNVVGENKYYSTIADLLKAKKINYKFLDVLEGKKLWSFYKAIDLLALTSINQTEAFGMVQVEAMLSGKPVVSSNLPGVRIPILETKMGLITEPKDAETIKVAINEILSDYKKYTNSKLHTRAIKIFKINKTYRFYNQLLESLTK